MKALRETAPTIPQEMDSGIDFFGDPIVLIQKLLFLSGFYEGEISGQLDDATIDAVKKFVKQRNTTYPEELIDVANIDGQDTDYVLRNALLQYSCDCSVAPGVGSKLYRRILECKSQTTIKKVMLRINEQGGMTLDDNTMKELTGQSYYAVSLENAEEQIPEKEFNEESITRYLHKHQDALQRPDHHLGAWVYNGLVYLDVSICIPKDAEGAQEQALDTAILNKQLAYYDLQERKEIKVEKETTGKL